MMKDISEGRFRKGRDLNRFEILAVVLASIAVEILAEGKYETVARGGSP